jgi:hypothetical protein
LTPKAACIAAFGPRVPFGAPSFEAKNMGTRVSVIQSDNKRIKLLRDPEGWVPVKGY